MDDIVFEIEPKADETLQVQENQDTNGEIHNLLHLPGMYKNWFLDYASYVILERAVPHVDDGLKPVQRRILHSMKRMEDGRYNKVANIIGHTMQFHPHGDASIGDALVQLGQKNLLIDTQGNWGNILTGDSAAAPRYIEARLSKFALDVAFNPKTTTWRDSYDGRNKEPINLPMKFPLLLAQGVEGIAVGLASKILPHNFNELIDASIAHLKGEKFELYPDFPTSGAVEVARYNDGIRGGKIRIRAKITKADKRNALIITELPFGTTTTQLIESIIAANDKGKIKIKKIDDNTAAHVEIVIYLLPNTSSDKTIDALYAFTECEISVSPNCCIIQGEKPRFIGVSEILRITTQNTLELLKMELQIRQQELSDEWHMSSLEKIFIENKIYLLIENCETWESVLQTIDRGLDPFKPLLRREVTRDDIVKLTEIKIKRISKYDAFHADEQIKSIELEMIEIADNLANIVQYTIKYYERIKMRYGAGRERKAEIRNFDIIEAATVVFATEKLYVNREEGFAGYGMKKDEFVCECSDIDEIIAFRRDGSYVIQKIAEKIFVGKDIIHIGIFRKNDERTTYNAIYSDGKSGLAFVKRFCVSGITRDKVYDVTQGEMGSKVLYFSANPNGEAETVRVSLKPSQRIKLLHFDFDFSTLAIKNRFSIGNKLSRNPVHKVIMKEKGNSTLGGLNVWFDFDVMRLNTDARGTLLGEFKGDDKLLVIYKNGNYELQSFDVTNHYDNEILIIEKFYPARIYSAVYYDKPQNLYYLKRFTINEQDRKDNIIGEQEGARLEMIIFDKFPRLELRFSEKHAKKLPEIVDVQSFITVKSCKAKGKRLSNYEISEIVRLEPIVTEEEVAEYQKEITPFHHPIFEVEFPSEEGEVVTKLLFE